VIVRVPPLAEILRRYEEIEGLLRRATARTDGCYEPEDVIALICAGRSTLLLVEDDTEEDRLVAVVVTELRIYPRRRVLDVGFIGGAVGHERQLREWVPALVERLEDMARQAGATMLSGCGRVGWARAAGFKISGGYVTRTVERKVDA